MEMTESEIVSKYLRNGKDSSQINILAELNGTTKDKIRDILIQNGAMNPNAELKSSTKRFSRKRFEISNEDKKKIIQLRKQGHTLKRISSLTDISLAVVRRELKEAGLLGDTRRTSSKNNNSTQNDQESTLLSKILSRIDCRIANSEANISMLKESKKLITEIFDELDLTEAG